MIQIICLFEFIRKEKEIMKKLFKLLKIKFFLRTKIQIRVNTCLV